MLAGLLGSTSGDATIFGYSINGNVSQIYEMLGYCAQFDILWDELTAEEHLYLFASLRGTSHVKNEVEKILGETRLTDVSRNLVSSYSGGMKRRLSVGIALIGNPKVVFLDEPTTGLLSRHSHVTFLRNGSDFEKTSLVSY